MQDITGEAHFIKALNNRFALDTAKNRGAIIENAVAVDYFFGGAAVLELARSGAGERFCHFSWWPEDTGRAKLHHKTRGGILIMHGSADTAITIDQFADLSKELESADVAHEMITYGGAQHAFTVFGGNRYQETADKKSWKRFKELLADTLKN